MANPSLEPGALAKPSKLDRDVAKHQKRVTKRSAKRAADKADAARWRAIGDAIFKRDRGCCRACFLRLHQRADMEPTRRAQAHHIVYRSAGGTDASSNLVLLCAVCHRWEHEHQLEITGDGDGLVTITAIAWSGNSWPSPCPSATHDHKETQ